MLTPDDAGRPAHEPPHSREELLKAAERDPADRQPPPFVGERVLFRRYQWGTTEGGVVTDVQDMGAHNDGHGGSDPDPNVWYPQDHERSGELRDDPWPWVSIALDSGGGARTKEARVRGGQGWLRPGSQGN